jgi:hypothetical protein
MAKQNPNPKKGSSVKPKEVKKNTFSKTNTYDAKKDAEKIKLKTQVFNVKTPLRKK